MNEIKKIALVTGAGRGIGKEIALELARAGIDIAVMDVYFPEDEESAKAEIKAIGGKAMEVKADVSDYDSVAEAVEKINKELGPINILVNNAGVTRDNLILRMSKEEWDTVININLTGAFNCTKAVIKQMTKCKWGRIVNISSVVGQSGNAGQVNYSSSKAGLIGFTKSLAVELATRNITVNAITPGFIDTDMTRNLSEKVREILLEKIPMKKLGTPRDIAKAIGFFVSDDSSYITGHVLAINGGMYM
jgi:3-oxoacyl-[acyl-carrier protein] reductase